VVLLTVSPTVLPRTPICVVLPSILPTQAAEFMSCV